MRPNFVYFLIGTALIWLVRAYIVAPMTTQSVEIPYSEFRQKLAAGQVVKVQIGDSSIAGEARASNADPAAPQVAFTAAFSSGSDPKLVEDLQKAGVQYGFTQAPGALASLLMAILPFVLIMGVWGLISRRQGGMGAGGGGITQLFGVGKSKATEVKSADVGVTFADVGGADEAIAELQDIIQFLKSPERFARLGGHIPKGVLLVGPPGTGKTLLAKATAGEANCAFFETSGSEFVEMFVGVGAARVRDLFAKARKAAPAIIFIDEIDAIGQSRSGTQGFSGNDEREQTLNQLLAEIDGFKTDAMQPVMLMAATNRPEVLDPALLRAGRFDRQVAVSNPDLAGRLQILKIHSRSITLAPEFDLARAARMTPGLSGADLANLMNEGALLAARRNAAAVTMADFEAAIERVVAGLEQKTRVMNERERNFVAVHESGHALIAELTPHGDPVAKVSIVPRGRGALGFTMQMPTEDRYLLTTAELEDRLAIMMAGRAAEQVVFGEISTGASDDIMRATELARRMVTEFGMSEKLGSVRYAGERLRYLGSVAAADGTSGQHIRELIDAEVQRLVTEQYDRAHALLTERRAALDALTQQLLLRETVDGSVVKQALQDTAPAVPGVPVAPVPGSAGHADNTPSVNGHLPMRANRMTGKISL